MTEKRSHRSSLLLAAVTAALTLILPYAVNAQNFSDAEIKAVYIYKLGKFVQWNGQKRSPIDFCYLESSKQDEEESVGKSFDKFVDSKNLGGEWRVKQLRGTEGISDCDILFIAASEESSISTTISQAGKNNVLTISDIKRFIYKEGMIGFVLDDQNRVKMEANLKNIRKTEVQVSAQVLEFMTQVIK